MSILNNPKNQFSKRDNGEQPKYWKSKLHGLEPINLPKDLFGSLDEKGKFLKVHFPKDSIPIEHLKNSFEDSSILFPLIGSLQVLLYRYSSQNDFCIGLSLEDLNLKELSENNGLKIDLSPLPIRSQLDSSISFDSLIQNTRDTFFEALENSNITIVEFINGLGNDQISDFLLDVVCIFRNQRKTESDHNNRKPNGLLDKNYNPILVFEFEESNKYLNGSISFRSDVYGEAFINRMIEHFSQLLDSIRLSPNTKISELNILSKKEKSFLIKTLNDTTTTFDESVTLLDLFEDQVKKNPKAIALEFEGNQLTYRQLDSKSNQLANYLNSIYFTFENPIPICLERSLEMVIAIFGILKSGRAYVPIDPALPKDRIDYMIEDIKAEFIICSSEIAYDFADEIDCVILDQKMDVLNSMPCEKLPILVLPENLAYIIYTSGSTGRPKGVMIEHRNVVNFLASMSKNVEFEAYSSLLSVTTYSFDIFYLELFLPLVNGGKVFLATREVAMDGFSLAQKLREVQPTHVQATPSGWQMLLNSGWKNPQNIKMLVGGEALSEELKDNLVGLGPLWNMYGPTETTIWSTYKKMELNERVNIGKPIDNTSVYILGPDGGLNPIGIPGELCIGGNGVGRGYLNREELTAQKFLPDPFSHVPGNRMYRSGDLAKWLPDGNIEYLGRMDDQVKIRGYRIELGEIESILLLHPNVKQAVVMARENGLGDKRLVGYVVCDGNFDKESVSAFLRSKLPEYMVPALWLQLEKLPLTFSGKTDRKALPDVGISDMVTAEYTEPRNDQEKQLAVIWQRILGLDRVGIHDDFFALGGHSLLAMRTVAAIRKEMGSEISIRDFFSAPSVAQLAQKLIFRGRDLYSHVPAVVARPETIPLSFNQQSLWFIHQLEGSIQYHIPLILDIKGKLDFTALEEAFKIILNRHEPLRTVIREKDGMPCQILLGMDRWKLDSMELLDQKLLDKQITSLIRIPFDLSADYMMRACLISLGPDRHCLVITLHHIASDGWPSNILKKELMESYDATVNGIEASLPPLSIQYIDYAIWQRKFLNSDLIQNKIDYWKGKLQNLSTLQLPTDFARPPVQSNNGNSYRFSIDNSLVSQLRELGQSHQATLFMTLLAAFKTLLYRYSGQEDICIGTPVAGRESGEMDDLIGFFVNTLAVRSNLRGNMGFTELIKDIRATTLESFEFQQVPFEMVVESLRQKRDLSRNPVFQVLFVLQNISKNEAHLDDVSISEKTYEHFTSKFDMAFELTEVDSGINGIAEYNTDLYRHETIVRFVNHFIHLLKSILENPYLNLDLLNIIPEEEKTLLLETLNATEAKYPHDKTIVDLFEEQVDKTPEAVALLFREKKLSYKELNEWSNQFAHYLIERYNIQPDDLVGIELQRSEWMVIGILAIIKSGGAYVPIDPEYPEQRKEFIKEDAKLKVLIDQVELEGIKKTLNQGKYPKTNPKIRISPENLMYVIYTSGSTGKPKGCMLEHRGLVNRLAWMQKSYPLTEKDCILQKTTFTFDVSVWELIWWSLQGASVSMLEPGGEKQPEKIVATIEASQVTVIHFVPSMLEVFLEYLGSSTEDILKLRSLKQVYTSGEALKTEQVRRFKELLPNVSLMNLYGPTEASIDVSYYACDTAVEQSIPIGKPIDNTALYVLSSTHQLVPFGTVGEICIGGVGLARGYLNRDELTREKFIKNPYRPKERLYRTGDLGRWRGDGNLEYLGRMDDQVKIRGYRIELGEIESILLLHPNVKQAVVMARENGLGDKRLVGYVVCDGNFDKESVSAFLRSKLPEYMVPALWLQLEKLPLTFSGKTDRKALPDVGISDMVTAEYTEPRNDQEKQLAVIWQRILGLDRVGIHDDFFALGGHSLLAMRTVAAIRKEMGSEISIRDFFSAPSVAQLAQKLIFRGRDLSSHVPAVVARPETIPLSFNQQSLWFIHQLEGSIQYHIPLILDIKGKLDFTALEEAFKIILNRHEPLRTVIREKDGMPCQILLGMDRWKLDSMELLDQKLLDKQITSLIRIPFDLSADYMMRACLISLGPDRHCLVITLHHIASDGWSSNILKKELMESYDATVNGIEASLPPLSIQYIDYAIWQRKFLNSDLIQNKIDYWKGKLQNLSTLQLPTDFARPPVQSNNGNSYRFSIDNSLVSQLRELGQSHQATLFMTLLAAFKTLLYRYSGQEDICIGTPVAGRESGEMDDLIGFFVNTLAVRSNLRGNMGFTELLKDIRATTLESFEFQQVPFEMVVESLRQKRDLSRNPVFQVLFVLQNISKNEAHLDDVSVSEKTYEHFTSKFDMAFELTEVDSGINGIAEYNTDLYRHETIVRFVNHFIHLLKSILENPSETIEKLKFLSKNEETELIKLFNSPPQILPNQKTILDLFQEQVRKSPDAIAVVFEGKKLSYSDLDKKSDQIANYLLAKGIKNEAMIPICLDRSFEMIIGILGIIKAGVAYVPIDPTYPEDRINFILRDSGANILLTTSDISEKFPDSIEILCLDTSQLELEKTLFEVEKKEISPNNLAYVIYTSGSTGTPKGVLIEHKGLLASTLARKSYYDKTGAVLMIPSFAFDSSVAVIFGALTSGEQLILCKSELIKSPHHIQELLKDTETILCVPSYYRFLQEENLLSDSKLLNVILAGENLDQSLVKLHFDKIQNVKLFNEYGPTEGTVWASVAQIHSPDENVTIGKPIDFTKIYILNKDNQLNPINVPGELCISGHGVARGYLNKPELNLEKFVKNPFDKTGKEKMYRTGDLARWLPDGNIEYLGRIDDQVKIRGYRIELGEIESVINKLNDIKESAVILREDTPGQKMLVGYVVLKDSTNADFISKKPAILKKELRSILPEYMVPNSIMILENLPLTSNNKIDRKRLPKPEEQKISQREPITEIEKLISKIWCLSLKKEKIDINADFFEIGGNSLLAVKVLSLLEKELDQKIPINIIFKYPRIVDLAEYIEGSSITESIGNSLVHIKPSGNKPPIYIVHGVGCSVTSYYKLAKIMEEEQPILGFQVKGLEGNDEPHQSIEEMASYYVSLMLLNNPRGPYHISGYSFGGYVAFEMAKQILNMGKEVASLVIFDTNAYINMEKTSFNQKVLNGIRKVITELKFFPKYPNYYLNKKLTALNRRIEKQLIRMGFKFENKRVLNERMKIIKKLTHNNHQMLLKYHLVPIKVDMTLFRVEDRDFFLEDEKFYGWKKFVENLQIIQIPGHHDMIFKEKHILNIVSKKLQNVLDEKNSVNNLK
ncbi:Phosphopantetheine attachment site [Aquiflexum balticum DSM 16537]|uniref:Phosphopantetheine attachment site n=1 Tax=Aquiflexum balticum DSM 16537 TaxID=758820 RepID=A0A1W2GYE0_9BACT|nr:non-ribosomal peptide synthetase [Aquiflexum balticum]SMD41574.1 Phosphopantetheine attachment site [Aquiflexum balticum DSM 16537]